MTSDSRNHIVSAVLVLLDPAFLAYDHSASRYLLLMKVVIANETLIRGNIHFDRVVDVVYCNPNEVAVGEVVHEVTLSLLHLSMSLCNGTESGGKREWTYPLNSSRKSLDHPFHPPCPLLPVWSIGPGAVPVNPSTLHDPNQSPLLV